MFCSFLFLLWKKSTRHFCSGFFTSSLFFSNNIQFKKSFFNGKCKLSLGLMPSDCGILKYVTFSLYYRLFFSRFFRVSGSENTLVPWVFWRNPWVFSRNPWVFWNFLEFFHKLLNFLQIFSGKVVRHWQNLNYIALIQAKRTIFQPKM